MPTGRQAGADADELELAPQKIRAGVEMLRVSRLLERPSPRTSMLSPSTKTGDFRNQRPVGMNRSPAVWLGSPSRPYLSSRLSWAAWIGTALSNSGSPARAPKSRMSAVRDPVAGLAWGPALPEQWGAPARPVDFFDVKADLEALVAPLTLRSEPSEHPALHPGRSARVLLDGREIGWLGAMHPMVQARLDVPGDAPVLFELDADALLARPVPVAGEISKFPPVVRDLAFLVDMAVPAARMLDEMRDECARNPLLSAVRSIDVFDEFVKTAVYRDSRAHVESGFIFYVG